MSLVASATAAVSGISNPAMTSGTTSDFPGSVSAVDRVSDFHAAHRSAGGAAFCGQESLISGRGEIAAVCSPRAALRRAAGSSAWPSCRPPRQPRPPAPPDRRSEHAGPVPAGPPPQTTSTHHEYWSRGTQTATAAAASAERYGGNHRSSGQSARRITRETGAGTRPQCSRSRPAHSHARPAWTGQAGGRHRPAETP